MVATTPNTVSKPAPPNWTAVAALSWPHSQDVALCAASAKDWAIEAKAPSAADSAALPAQLP